MNSNLRKKKLDIQKAFAAGYTPTQIQEFASKNPSVMLYDSSQGLGSPETAMAEEGSWADWLPVAGAIVGSFVPGLGTIAGGAVGAGLGTVAKQFLDKKEGFDTGEVLKETALGGVGGVIGKGVSSVAGKVLPKAVKGLSAVDEALSQGTRKIKLPASVFGAAKEKAIHKTLNKYGFRGPAQKQYEMLQPTLSKIESRIQKFITANPELSVSKKQIQEAFINNLKSALRSKDLTEKQAIKEVTGYLNDLLKASGGTGKFKEIPLERLRNLKKLVNEDYGSVFNKIQKGTSLTPREKVISAAWDSLDDSIKEVSPLVKKLLVDESNLYKAAQSLSSARVNPPTFRIAGTSVPAFATQAGRDIVGKTTKIAGKSLKQAITSPAVGTAGNIATQSVAQTTPRLLVPKELENEADNNYGQYDNGQSMQHAGSLPSNPSNVQFQNQTVSSGLGETPTLTGHTPEEIYQGYQKALAAGDRTNASALRQMFEDEVAWQKTQGAGKEKKKTEKQQSFVNAAAAAQDALNLLESGQVSTGVGQGLVGGLGEKLGTNTQAQQEYRSTVALARTAARNAMLGANMTPKELESISAFIPEYNDAPNIARTKLQTFIRLMNEFGMNMEGTAQGLPANPQDVVFAQ